MNVGSLFSGIGGIEIGFERQGFTTEWFVEKDPYCQAVLRKHWASTPIYDDITTINFGQLPRVDVLTGGFPCQDISNAGKRVGISGEKSSLWKYYLEAIRILRPKYAVIENVSALAYRGLSVVLADLAQIGYDAVWTNLRASDIGAPHRRERIFIISYPHSGFAEAGAIQAGWLPSWYDCPDVPDTQGIGLQGEWAGGEQKPQLYAEKGLPLCLCQDVPNATQSGQLREEQLENNSQGERARWRFDADTIREVSGGWWAVESSVCRVANAIPFRVDRIKCLGNAVVPACAEVIARAIKEYEMSKGENNEHNWL